jgi:hypothetical protein
VSKGTPQRIHAGDDVSRKASIIPSCFGKIIIKKCIKSRQLSSKVDFSVYMG